MLINKVARLNMAWPRNFYGIAFLIKSIKVDSYRLATVSFKLTSCMKQKLASNLF